MFLVFSYVQHSCLQSYNSNQISPIIPVLQTRINKTRHHIPKHTYLLSYGPYSHFSSFIVVQKLLSRYNNLRREVLANLGVCRALILVRVSAVVFVCLWTFIKIIYNKWVLMYQKRKISFPLLPSMDMDKLPQFNPSLQMINTIKGIKMQSQNNIDMGYNNQGANNNEEFSSERCSIIQTAMNTSKKKKIGCTCKKTYCLKMYCECFALGKECGDDCMCLNCKNTPQFKEEILQAKNNIKEGGMRNCSLSQKKCNCKKSKCLKKYCECFNAGIGCSPACKCQDCQNRQPQKEESHEQNLESFQQMQVKAMLNGKSGTFPSLVQFKSEQDVQKYMND